MKEDDIRPKRIFDEYLRLAERDTQNISLAANISLFTVRLWSQRSLFFTKHSFDYEECPGCQTLFVSPRPPAESFSRYYQESESARYWASTFYKRLLTRVEKNSGDESADDTRAYRKRWLGEP